MIDKDSIKVRNMRGAEYLLAQRGIIEVIEAKEELQIAILKQNGAVTNNQLRDLKQMNEEIKKLTQYSLEQTSYPDDKISNLQVEYGINDISGFGIKIGYTQNKFVLYPYGTKYSISNDVEVFIKAILLSNDNWALTIQPKLHMNNTGNIRKNAYAPECGVFLGNSYQTKYDIRIFSELGIFAGRSLEKDNNFGGFSFTQGVKSENGLIFYNFVQYHFRENDNRIYSKSVYEQISFAKEINFGRVKRNNFTISAGYFFDQSLVDKNFKISGPIFSLWFNI